MVNKADEYDEIINDIKQYPKKQDKLMIACMAYICKQLDYYVINNEWTFLITVIENEYERIQV